VLGERRLDGFRGLGAQHEPIGGLGPEHALGRRGHEKRVLALQGQEVLGTEHDAFQEFAAKPAGRGKTPPQILVVVGRQQQRAVAGFAGGVDRVGEGGQLAEKLAQFAVDVPGMDLLGRAQVVEHRQMPVERHERQEIDEVAQIHLGAVQRVRALVLFQDPAAHGHQIADFLEQLLEDVRGVGAHARGDVARRQGDGVPLAQEAGDADDVIILHLFALRLEKKLERVGQALDMGGGSVGVEVGHLFGILVRDVAGGGPLGRVGAVHLGHVGAPGVEAGQGEIHGEGVFRFRPFPGKGTGRGGGRVGDVDEGPVVEEEFAAAQVEGFAGQGRGIDVEGPHAPKMLEAVGLQHIKPPAHGEIHELEMLGLQKRPLVPVEELLYVHYCDPTRWMPNGPRKRLMKTLPGLRVVVVVKNPLVSSSTGYLKSRVASCGLSSL